jgi:hypothetical protein
VFYIILCYIFFELYLFAFIFNDISSLWCSPLCCFHGVQPHSESPHFFFHFCIRSASYGWNDSTASPFDVYKHNQLFIPLMISIYLLSPFCCCLQTNSIALIPPILSISSGYLLCPITITISYYQIRDSTLYIKLLAVLHEFANNIYLKMLFPKYLNNSFCF